MPTTTVLFVCPDNSLLGQMAEAYLNFRAGGLMRAFSAGVTPAESVHEHAKRLLCARGLDVRGLQPKPVDVFLMPHSVVPDRIVYLTDMDAVKLPAAWKGMVSSHWWSIAPKPPYSNTFSACSGYWARISAAIDQLVEPVRPENGFASQNVA